MSVLRIIYKYEYKYIIYMDGMQVCIGNSMFSSAIWKKHARVSFSKTIKILLIYMKKLCSHVRKSHLEIKKFEK